MIILKTMAGKTRAKAQVKPGRWIREQLCVRMARACNLYCVYCQAPPSGEAAAPEAVAAEARKKRVTAVSLEGGGEPTAGGDIFAWIKTLRAAGVKSFMLSTNAVALSDLSLCRRLERAVDSFTVNFPASDPELYRLATRSVKFALALKGLENLKSLGAEGKVRLFHIIFRGNCRALPEFADWVIKNFPGIAFVNFTFVRNLGRVGNSAAIVPRYGEAAPFVKLALAKLKRKGIKAVVQNMPLCILENFEGFAFEYQRWRRGDPVFEAGVPAGAPSAACGRCALKNACCGARADYVKIHGSKELRPSARDPRSIRPEKF